VSPPCHRASLLVRWFGLPCGHSTRPPRARQRSAFVAWRNVLEESRHDTIAAKTTYTSLLGLERPLESRWARERAELWGRSSPSRCQAPKLREWRFPNSSFLSYFCGSLSEPQGVRHSDLCLSCNVHPGNARTHDVGFVWNALGTPLISRGHRDGEK